VTRDPVCRLELVGHVDVPGRRSRVAEPGGHVGAQRDARHRLDAAGDAGRDGAGGDQVVDQVRGLLARAALRVDGGRTGVPRQAGVQPGTADHVVGLLARLGHASADHLLHERRVDPDAGQHLALDVAEQLCGMHTGERAPAPAQGGADGLDDDGGAHGATITRGTRTCSRAAPFRNKPPVCSLRS
jgi:hypothetical protein